LVFFITSCYNKPPNSFEDKEQKIPIIPYCYDDRNQHEFIDHTSIISQAVESAFTLAKEVRKEILLPNIMNAVRPVPEPLQPPAIPVAGTQAQPSSTFNFPNPLRRKTVIDTTPLQKMEQSIIGIEQIIDSYKNALAWHEVEKAIGVTKYSIHTYESLDSERRQWIAIFGYKIEPNLFLALRFGAQLKEREARQRSENIAVARSRQEERERHESAGMMGGMTPP